MDSQLVHTIQAKVEQLGEDTDNALRLAQNLCRRASALYSAYDEANVNQVLLNMVNQATKLEDVRRISAVDIEDACTASNVTQNLDNVVHNRLKSFIIQARQKGYSQYKAERACEDTFAKYRDAKMHGQDTSSYEAFDLDDFIAVCDQMPMSAEECLEHLNTICDEAIHRNGGARQYVERVKEQLTNEINDAIAYMQPLDQYANMKADDIIIKAQSEAMSVKKLNDVRRALTTISSRALLASVSPQVKSGAIDALVEECRQALASGLPMPVNIQSYTEVQFLDYCSTYMNNMQTANARAQEMRAAEAQMRQNNLQQEMETVDCHNEISKALMNKNIHVVTPQGLADDAMEAYASEIQERYFNNPMFFVYKIIGTSRFDELVNNHVKKVEQSNLLKEEIAVYLDEKWPDRGEGTDELYYDQLIELIPPAERTQYSNTPKVMLAFRAVQLSRDLAAKEEEKKRQEALARARDEQERIRLQQQQAASTINANQIPQEDIIGGYVAMRNHGEPTEAAEYGVVSNGLRTMARNGGQQISWTGRAANVVRNAFHAGPYEPLRGYANQYANDPRYAQNISEWDAHYNNNILGRNRNGYPPNYNQGYSPGYTNQGYAPGYGNRSAYSYNNQMGYGRPAMPGMGILIPICHIAIILLLLLMEKVFKTGMLIPCIGVAIAMVGWFKRSSALRRNTPDRSWLILVIIGYVVTFLAFCLT